MRLIDADRLKPDVQAWTAEKKFEYRYSPEVINNAPTVEAIPIEWLKRFKAGECQDSYWSWFTDRLIKMWREEQSNE